MNTPEAIEKYNVLKSDIENKTLVWHKCSKYDNVYHLPNVQIKVSCKPMFVIKEAPDALKNVTHRLHEKVIVVKETWSYDDGRKKFDWYIYNLDSAKIWIKDSNVLESCYAKTLPKMTKD